MIGLCISIYYEQFQHIYVCIKFFVINFLLQYLKHLPDLIQYSKYILRSGRCRVCTTCHLAGGKRCVRSYNLRCTVCEYASSVILTLFWQIGGEYYLYTSNPCLVSVGNGPANYFSASPAVQPLMGLFLPHIHLLVQLFSL